MAFVKIHNLASSRGQMLNGKTGEIRQWNKFSWRYEVHVLAFKESFMLKGENLCFVSETWLQEVKSLQMRGSRGAMMELFDAPGRNPPRVTALRSPPRAMGGQGIEQAVLLNWWGWNVYQYIRQRMEEQSWHRGWMNWAMYDACQRGQLWIAAVWCDGGSEHGQTTTGQNFGNMWWPTIVFGPVQGIYYGSYCQGLALMPNASAWLAHPDNLVIFVQYGMVPPPPPFPPHTVTVEELSDEDGHVQVADEVADEDEESPDEVADEDEELLLLQAVLLEELSEDEHGYLLV